MSRRKAQNRNNAGHVLLVWFLVVSLILTGCNATSVTATPTLSSSNTNSTPQTSAQPTPEPTAVPDPINPLTGLVVEKPSLLDLPAALVSISTFPVTARPQAGLSFAPYVFEIYITEGTTRYLATFYGEFPAPESPPVGVCNVRREPFEQTDLIIGNRVWLDTNQNNIQDDWERGVGGVCANLHGANGELLQQTSTDSNGYYGFNVSAGSYFVAFAKPNGMEFSQKQAGHEDKDSDVDQTSGWSDALDIQSSLLDLDVGLVPSESVLSTSNLPPAQVGPVRSGRLVYADIARFFEDSCLIYAYASAEVLVELPQCYFVDHNIQGGGYMLEISKLIELVRERKDTRTRERYKSNAFSLESPAGGEPASRLDVYVAWLNQTGWVYDPLSQTWWRYVDDGEEATAGVLHPEIDRLTERQLQFENVIIVFTEHDVISPTNLDIRLDRGRTGRALLFRDGQMYSIRWSAKGDAPIRFQDKDGKLFPLKPGRTWITVVTPNTAVTEQDPGEWLLQFSQPKGAK